MKTTLTRYGCEDDPTPEEPDTLKYIYFELDGLDIEVHYEPGSMYTRSLEALEISSDLGEGMTLLEFCAAASCTKLQVLSALASAMELESREAYNHLLGA